MRKRDQPRTHFGIPADEWERQGLSVIIVILKHEEFGLFDREAGRRGLTDLELVRYAIQRLRETSPNGLPPDRGIVAAEIGVGKMVLVDREARREIAAECRRLDTDESDLIRQAFLTLRHEDPPSVDGERL
jgi:hypothetical protein